MKRGEKQRKPFPKDLREKLWTDEHYLVENIMNRPSVRNVERPFLYTCEFCNGFGVLHNRINNYECHDCAGQGGPPISWNELKGRVMNKSEKQAWGWGNYGNGS